MQDDRPSSEIPHQNRENLQAPTRVCDVEGGAVCSKIVNLAISVEPREPRVCGLLPQLAPIMAPGSVNFILLLTEKIAFNR